MKDDTDQNSLISYITSNFYRLAQDGTDDKALLTLIAAIGMMNISDEQAQAAAKRLATLALTMSKTKVKKEK